MSTVYLNIGSNKGHRYALIELAMTLVSASYPEASVRRSSFIESEPWGFKSSNKFLNIGLALDFPYSPNIEVMLSELQDIERKISPDAHRNPDGSYRDRGIDIDIIAVDTRIIDLPHLKVPHPLAYAREFVMAPLRELAPAEVLELLEQCGSTNL